MIRTLDPVTFKLKGHEAASCHVDIYSNNTISFHSYSTEVIIAYPIAFRKFQLKCTGTYSPTTRKQIGWFLREYFPNVTYQDMKEVAGTGELVSGALSKETIGKVYGTLYGE